MSEHTAEFDAPDISAILRARLIESLMEDGVLAGDAEVVADEVIAFARERGAQIRERRSVTPPDVGGS